MLTRWQFVILFVVLLFAFSSVQAQEDGFIPDNLPVITPDNLDQVVEIAAFGNGGVGKLYWSSDGRILAMNSSYGTWFHHLDALDEPPVFIPEPDLDVLIFSYDGSLAVAWEEGQNKTPARVWNTRTGEQVTVWDVDDISEDPNWRYQTTIERHGPQYDPMQQYDVTIYWDIVTDTTLPTNPIKKMDPALWQFEPTYGMNYSHVTSPSGALIFIEERLVGNQPKVRLAIHRTSDSTLVTDVPQDAGEIWEAVGFTADDRFFVVYHAKTSLVKVFDIESGMFVLAFTLDETNHGELIILENSRLLVADQNFSTYDLLTGERLSWVKIPVMNDDKYLFDSALSLETQALAKVSETGVLRIWDTTRGLLIYETDRYQTMGEIKAISPDATTILVYVHDTKRANNVYPFTSLEIWDVDTAAVTQTLELYGETFYPVIEYSPDGTQFALNSGGPFDMRTGYFMWEQTWFDAIDIAYSPDGKYFAAVAGDGFTMFYEQPPIYHSMAIYSIDGSLLTTLPALRFSAVAFSPDSRYIAANWGGGVAIWELEAFLQEETTPLVILSAEDSVGEIVFSPDGTQLLMGYAKVWPDNAWPSSRSGFCSGSIWNIEEILQRAQAGETRFESAGCLYDAWDLGSHGTAYFAGPMRTIRFSPNADMILFYGEDYSDFAPFMPMTIINAQERSEIRQFGDQSSFVMSPDGTFMISTGDDERIHYWAVVDGD